MLCLFAPDYQTVHARSNLKKKVTMLITYILFIFIDIDNTYTCTYVVSRLFAPRTMNYIQVVLPVNMLYELQTKHYERGHENHRCMSIYKKKT